MLKLIADLIRAGMGWHDLYRRDRNSRQRDLEDRLAPHLAAAATDPVVFSQLLDNLPDTEIEELHRRLMGRVTYFGTILNRRDREAFDTIVWSTHEVRRRLPNQETGMIRTKSAS